MSHETIKCDVVIVGAGPAGLSAAIRLKQLNPQCHICVLEKGAAVGSHILSGAVLEPRVLNELLPDWQAQGAPLHIAASEDQFLFLTQRHAVNLPTPRPMKNNGNYIISLGEFCRWLANCAEQLGVEIYPGFAAVDMLLNDSNEVIGVLTGDMGVAKDGEKTQRFQAGIAIHAKYVMLAEGCHGSLSKKIISHFQLDKHCAPQTYALGVKEIWEVAPEQHSPGKIIHTVGWPLDTQTYGGSFIYHGANRQVAVGFVVGLDYQNPTLDPFAELQRFKTHPKFIALFKNGKRIAYGARALSEGGFQALPRLNFPGGLLIGDAAGFLNVPKIKGIHMAMQSGVIAAEVLNNGSLETYQQKLSDNWIWDELYRARNIRPGFQKGLYVGLANAALDTYIFKGHAPWTLHYSADHLQLKKIHEVKPIKYPKPDNLITFDKLSSLYLANIHHDENQPNHLKINETKVMQEDIYHYGGPESYY
jgi:electron-transferring-flavoprotein dehydrogenase